MIAAVHGYIVSFRLHEASVLANGASVELCGGIQPRAAIERMTQLNLAEAIVDVGQRLSDASNTSLA